MNPNSEVLLLGIDLGAGSLKATIIDADGHVKGEASHAVRTLSPHPGWSEQDPADWWAAAVAAVPRAIAAGKIDSRRIAATSFSAGAHTQVLEDADGRVIRPAILWNDQRSREETMELRRRADRRILEIAYNRANPTWTLPQMAWLKAHEPAAFARVKRMYLAKDWLRARFTGTFETDDIDALGALMVDARTRRWSKELCDMIGWPMESLTPIVASKSVVGRVTRDAAAATGLAQGTPVVCGASDTAVVTYGAGLVEEGIGCLKLATEATVSVLSRKAVPDFELINYFHFVPEHWYVIVGTNSCASAHRWLRDNFFMRPGDDGAAVFAEMDRLAGPSRRARRDCSSIPSSTASAAPIGIRCCARISSAWVSITAPRISSAPSTRASRIRCAIAWRCFARAASDSRARASPAAAHARRCGDRSWRMRWASRSSFPPSPMRVSAPR